MPFAYLVPVPVQYLIPWLYSLTTSPLLLAVSCMHPRLWPISSALHITRGGGSRAMEDSLDDLPAARLVRRPQPDTTIGTRSC